MVQSYCIENEYLRIRVTPVGAEVVSIWSKVRNQELLWQGEEWKGRAPILFPIVGNLPQGQYTVQGKRYELPRHGLARDSRFELRHLSPNSVTLGLHDSEQSWCGYPYAFDLSVTYRLDDHTLKVVFCVANYANEKLMFSLGFHPAFSASNQVELLFEQSPKNYCYGDQGFVDFSSQPQIALDTVLPISSVDFSRGAIYLREIPSQQIILRDGARELGISLPDVPYVVIWKKPGCSFICIEPCFGITSPSMHDVLSLTEKPGIRTLDAGETFTTMSEITAM